jgi:hypothetical protein
MSVATVYLIMKCQLLILAIVILTRDLGQMSRLRCIEISVMEEDKKCTDTTSETSLVHVTLLTKGIL